MVNTVSGSATALQGQINRDRSDLNDWVSCVSAKTPAGRAEIQKISGEISAAKEQINRVESGQDAASTQSFAAAGEAVARSIQGSLNSSDPAGSGGNLDAWA